MRLSRNGLSSLLIAAGLLCLASPLVWVAYTSRLAAAEQTTALAAWERHGTVTRPGPVAGRAPRDGLLLTIPRLNLQRYVPEGATSDMLRRYGLGRISWTPMPSASGIVGIAGHRTTYGAPFFRLDRLRPGDTILLESGGRRYSYAVTSSRTVVPEQVDAIESSSPERGIALVTCTPPYSAAYRLVVLARLVSVTAPGARR